MKQCENCKKFVKKVKCSPMSYINKAKATTDKQKPIILDDNEFSIICYAREFPENWKRICNSLKEYK